MEVSGIIKLIREEQQVSSTFKKREVILTTEEQYPQHLSIDFVQDKTDLLNAFSEGQKVTIKINLRGREWTSPQGELKYFNTLQGWQIIANASEQTPQQVPPQPAEPDPLSDSNDEDDLPF